MDTMPELLATVRLHRSGPKYLVVDVNFEARTVELLSIGGLPNLVPDVPVERVQELLEEPPPDNP